MRFHGGRTPVLVGLARPVAAQACVFMGVARLYWLAWRGPWLPRHAFSWGSHACIGWPGAARGCPGMRFHGGRTPVLVGLARPVAAQACGFMVVARLYWLAWRGPWPPRHAVSWWSHACI